jgi:hypothetical protein
MDDILGAMGSPLRQDAQQQHPVQSHPPPNLFQELFGADVVAASGPASTAQQHVGGHEVGVSGEEEVGAACSGAVDVKHGSSVAGGTQPSGANAAMDSAGTELADVVNQIGGLLHRMPGGRGEEGGSQLEESQRAVLPHITGR